jgi:hypothetical protein
MHECPVDHPALPALFDSAVPDNPVLWAALSATWRRRSRSAHFGCSFGDNLSKETQP